MPFDVPEYGNPVGNYSLVKATVLMFDYRQGDVKYCKVNRYAMMG